MAKDSPLFKVTLRVTHSRPIAIDKIWQDIVAWHSFVSLWPITKPVNLIEDLASFEKPSGDDALDNIFLVVFVFLHVLIVAVTMVGSHRDIPLFILLREVNVVIVIDGDRRVMSFR